MDKQKTKIRVCVEGSPWPDRDVAEALEELDRVVEARLQRRVLAYDQYGRARVGYGLVGYIRTRGTDLYVAPKCLHVSDVGAWAAGVTEFLSLCSGLTSRDVAVSGPGLFSAKNVLLPWWADYYSRVLRRALHAMPFLQYQSYAGCLPYIRGRIDWAAQASEWARCSSRMACSFKRYQADHPLNRLLKWAATYFSRIVASSATGVRLGLCIETFGQVLDIPPEPLSVARIRIPASHGVYREPFVIARSLYESLFPTLAIGRIPSWGFVVDMVRAFESFVAGLVRRAVSIVKARGQGWTCVAQDQELLASPVTGSGGTFYTRPDNVVWTVGAEDSKRGVVIDAKYKGLARHQGSYYRPDGSDFYQVLVACVSRGWNRALIVAPVAGTEEPWKELEWAVRMPGVGYPIHISLVKVDLKRLAIPGEAETNVKGLLTYLERVLAERPGMA